MHVSNGFVGALRNPFISIALIASIVAWSFSTSLFVPNATAAALTSFSDTLTDSDISALSNHTISYTTENGVSAGETIVVTFPASFNLGDLSFNDIDLFASSERTLGTSASGATWGVATTSTTITFTSGTDTIASSTAVVIEIGTNATSGATGNTQITNPGSSGSYVISVASGSGIDSGDTRVYILDDVVVTASVDTTLTFVISGVVSGQTVNSSPTTTADTTTSTSVPFGTLAPGTSKVLAQDLAVTTNANNGFVVTVQQDQNLTSSSNADIDGFIDGAYTNSPTGWVDPTGSTGLENTYGHFGLTSEDDLNGDEFGSDLWVSASTTARQVFHHNGVADGSTANVGATRVGYQVQITSLQEAGNDYSNTLTYIATPTF